MLSLKNLSCGYFGKPVIEGLNLDVSAGDILCILGANGIGKTTLYRTILNTLCPVSGQITLNGEDTQKMRREDFAKKIAYVPQTHLPAFPFKVLDMVTMGRTVHLSLFAAPDKHDEAIAFEAMERLGIAKLAHRPYTEISGGERQLVLIARALVQDAEILLMDEPTSNLDFGHQMQLLEQIKGLAGEKRAIMYTTHYPNHAFACATKVLALMGGQDWAFGTAEAILTEPILKRVYGIDVDVRSVTTRNGVSTVCIPIPVQ